MAFAENTKVPVTQTRGEIETLLRKHGADAFGYTSEPGVARIAFRMRSRHYRFLLPLPKLAEQTEEARRRQGQAERARWRALLLVIKAKLEAASVGITTIEDEFLAQTVLPDGETVGEWAAPQLAVAYTSGAMPASLMIEGPRR